MSFNYYLVYINYNPSYHSNGGFEGRRCSIAATSGAYLLGAEVPSNLSHVFTFLYSE